MPKTTPTWRPQFSMRTMVVSVILLGCIVLPLFGRCYEHANAIARLEVFGNVYFDDERLQRPLGMESSNCLGFSRAIFADGIRNVKELSLQKIDPSEFAECIPWMKKIPEVKSLDFWGSSLTAQDLKQLPMLYKVEWVRFEACPLFDDEAAIVMTKKLPDLNEILLGGTLVSDRTANCLARIPRLGCLGLSKTKVSDKGLAPILDVHLLWYLDVSSTEITSAGLTNLKRQRLLKVLDVSRTKVNDMVLKELVSLAELSELRVRGALVTDNGLSDFKMLRPDVRIVR